MSGASVSSVVKAQTVIEAVVSKLSSCTITAVGWPLIAAGSGPDIAVLHSKSSSRHKSDTASMKELILILLKARRDCQRLTMRLRLETRARGHPEPGCSMVSNP